MSARQAGVRTGGGRVGTGAWRVATSCQGRGFGYWLAPVCLLASPGRHPWLGTLGGLTDTRKVSHRTGTQGQPDPELYVSTFLHEAVSRRGPTHPEYSKVLNLSTLVNTLED